MSAHRKFEGISVVLRGIKIGLKGCVKDSWYKGCVLPYIKSIIGPTTDSYRATVGSKTS